MRIPETKLAEVAAAADIVQVISQYVDLKRAGKDFRGLCPFHGDKDPSFYVSPQKGIFHCFGCTVGGSVFNFLMRMENISFVEAVRMLAQRYGVEIPDYRPGGVEKDNEKQRLIAAVEAAQAYFRRRLEINSAVQEYLDHRGVPFRWFEPIGLGFAPESWDGLLNHLTHSGVDLRDAASLGLIKSRQTGGYYDSFRSRVMIPIRDLNGGLTAFGGRIYGEGDPKYLNSPESSLFHKRRVLYGFDTAKEAIRKEGRIILVEGYFDQISLRVRGLENVVAPLGTALGIEQVKLIHRFTDEVITIFDGDEAGLRAARRAIPLFMAEGIEPRCIILRDDKDPDEAINRIGADSFREMVDNAGSMIDFLLDDVQARHDVTTMKGRDSALEDCIPVLLEIADSRGKDYLIERFASRLRIREERLRSAVRREGAKHRRNGSTSRKPRAGLFEFPLEERQIVRGMLLLEEAWNLVSESGILEDISDPILRTVTEAMVSFHREHGGFDPSVFCSTLDNEEVVSVVAGLLQPRSEEDDLPSEVATFGALKEPVDAVKVVSDSIDAIRRRKLEKRKTEIQVEMNKVPPAGDEYNTYAAELWKITKDLRK